MSNILFQQYDVERSTGEFNTQKHTLSFSAEGISFTDVTNITDINDKKISKVHVFHYIWAATCVNNKQSKCCHAC